MSLPYFPLYPTDFEADTSHLTLAEDGAYNRLLRLMWMTPGCSLPDDDAWILRRMRCTSGEDSAVVLRIIAEFFQHVMAHLPDDLCARVIVLIDPVTKAHQPERILFIFCTREVFRYVIHAADLI